MKISNADKNKNLKKVRRDEFREIAPSLSTKIVKNKKAYTRKNKHKKGNLGSPSYLYCVLSFIFQIFDIRLFTPRVL